jgi:hypothetical protein
MYGSITAIQFLRLEMPEGFLLVRKKKRCMPGRQLASSGEHCPEERTGNVRRSLCHFT